MAQDIKKRKGSNRKKLFLTFFLTISIYFLISYVPAIFGFSNKTILPEKGTLYSKTPAEGYVIKDEIVYKAEGSGVVNKIINEGERVPVGIEVANIKTVKDTSQLMTELNEIESKITKLLNTEIASISTEDSGETGTYNDQVLEEIQDIINSEDYVNINDRKKTLQSNDSKINNSTLIEHSLELLLEKKEFLRKQINGSELRFYAKRTGILSYQIDGYENIFKPVEFENYTYDKLFVREIDFNENDKEEVSVGEPLFKIINNFEWYMAIKVESKEDIEQYKLGQALVLELDDGTELKGKIVSINITDDKAVVVLYLNTYLHSNYNLRITPLNIVHYKKDGLKIPSKVIINKDGTDGVLIKEINGIVKFRPISIIGEEGDYTFIDNGDNNGYIKLEGIEKGVRTVSLFDEILNDPTSFTEGEILD